MAKELPSEVELGGQNLDDAGLLELVRKGAFPPDAGVLSLDDNRLTAEALRGLAHVGMIHVHTLSIRNNRLADDGAGVLASEAVFAGVKSLNLGGNGITSVGVRQLFSRTSVLSGPFWLALAGNPIGDDGVRWVAASDKARYLQTLTLDSTGMTDLGASFIIGSTHLSALQHLTVVGNGLSAAVVAKLRASPTLRGCLVTAD